MTPFGATLAAIRSRRLSQVKLADRSGVDRSYISRLEDGSRNPSRLTVLALADALDATGAERNALLGAAGYASAHDTDPLVAELDAMLRDETLCAACREDVRQVVTMTLVLARRRLQEAA